VVSPSKGTASAVATASCGEFTRLIQAGAAFPDLGTGTDLADQG
jgi:hypothetical protein